MISRTYGWVQNPSDFSKLKQIVQIFDNSSKHYRHLEDHLIEQLIPFPELKQRLLEKFRSGVETFSYSELVGGSVDITGGSAKTRAHAVANGIIQITVLPQNHGTTGKKWTDNWTSDGFLRWALSLNFVEHDRVNDTCSITPLGKELSRTEDESNDELEIFRRVLLSYPPATRVMRILKEAGRAVTKFYIGNKLGFQGEGGFTSYNEELMRDWFQNAPIEERSSIKSDVEGTSDKYARMICSWLSKIGYVEKEKDEIETRFGRATSFPKYYLNARGTHALAQSEGSSINRINTKFLTWEFLATSGRNRDYHRTRRGHILKQLQKSSSFSVLLTELRRLGFEDDTKIILNDIRGLNNIGIRIDAIEQDANYVLRDRIVEFDIPSLNLTEQLKDIYIEKKKAKFLNETNLPMKFIELLEIAFDGNKSRDLEFLTAELFETIYGLKSVLLGGPRKPDVIAFTDNFGLIIDTKAYKFGYQKSITQEDQMVRYIEDNIIRSSERNPAEWWLKFHESIPPKAYYFLWISGRFADNFPKQLQATHERTGAFGGALNVEQLLLGADAVMKSQLDVRRMTSYFLNKEIIWIN